MAQSAYSRHLFAGTATDSAGRIYTLERIPFRFEDREDNIIYKTKAGERWWHLAQRFYSDISDNAGPLYWIICDYQVPPILDPTLQIEPGTLVVAPSQIVVLTEIFGYELKVYQ